MNALRSIYRGTTWRACGLIAACAAFAGCATSNGERNPQVREGLASATTPVETARLLDRVTWGINDTTADAEARVGWQRYLDAQLHPLPQAALPSAVQAQIDQMTITQKPLSQLVVDLEAQRKSNDAIANDEDKKAAQQAYQQELNRLGREASTRFLLRALYSPNQLQEQMTWFWMNHFNVHQYKHMVRALVGDYEDRAIRPNALGRFRDLLGATAHHPAMLVYLDNAQNAAGHINENYARELMELHTLGVDAGYTQRDVQELARVLTGVGVNFDNHEVKIGPRRIGDYVHNGLFEFNPNRHDYGDKVLLGTTIKGRGVSELDQALDLLARQPATARFVSRKIAQYFVSDAPPPALVERMAQTFLRADGDIAATLRTMFDSPEFAASLHDKFKDPVHYVVSAVRLAYNDKPILNAGPMLNWLNRMGEPLYGHQTPDGYSLERDAWASPGQMNTRFEIARAIGGGSAGLFKTEGERPLERPAFPQLSNALYFKAIAPALGTNTRAALDQAMSPQEWNGFLLASPEFMMR